VSRRRLRIVLQARTTSTRLPAKGLLPIGGVPLALLCARRLGTTGREVILATSEERSDDLLAALAAEHGIRVYRGSLNDVLSRFLGCIADLANEDLVVRATADNPVPDGPFLERLLGEFDQINGRYLGTSSPQDGLPYGLSAEIFSAGALRESACEPRDPLTSEHVTPSLRAAEGDAGIVRAGVFLERDRSSVRVTIDTLDDYLLMADVFRRVPDAQHASWRELIDITAQRQAAGVPIASTVVQGRRYSCLTLGTAQLGLDYGITNHRGRPSDAEALAILSAAVEGGITQIDTARAYGDAERRIGRSLEGSAARELRIMSKLPPLSELTESATPDAVASAVDSSVQGSCRDIRRSQVDVMMFHRCTDMFRWQGAALDRLHDHLLRGTIGAIGVSVYTPLEASRVLADSRITQLEIPFNLLDQRWLLPEFQRAAALRPDVAIHVRSVFLQGLLLNPAERWPSWVETAPRLCADIRHVTESLQRASAADLCIAFVRAFPWVTSLVVGVESAAQLAELLWCARQPPLGAAQAAKVSEIFSTVNERLLNPSLW
jgi:spore coat polysaccharide biosynthesis protein SpsF (cytidylyltransferase family)/aryl-alcohol dehydrogenase-like predicted oxidoreductase